MIAVENVRNPNQLSARTRWIVHVAILCVPILLSIFSYSLGHEAKLPQTGLGLARFISLELLMWGLAFAAAFRMSGITVTQLCLRVANPLKVIIHGIGYFLVIRFIVFVILAIQIQLLPSDSAWKSSETVFTMMDHRSMLQHPAFSFTVYGITALIAGLTEEMWRVGMLRGLQNIFPRLNGGRWAGVACIFIVSLIFGVAHLYLGWLGVENAVLLGFFFGLIVVFRNSYWEAAIAHALFDGLSFALIAVVVFHPQIFNAAIVVEAEKGDIPKVEHFLNIGGDVNSTFGEKKISALEMAAESHPAMVQFLLEKGADPNWEDADGDTPLIAAAEAGQLECFNLLVAKGAELNTRHGGGRTVLHFAVEDNRLEIVKRLIELGTDVNSADDKGRTPLELARKKGYGEIADLLDKNGAK